MKAINKFPAILVVAAVMLAGLVRADASQLLYSQLSDGQSTYGPSELWASGVNSGTPTGTGHIDNLSANTLDRSGYLEIFGSNFGGNLSKAG